MPIKIMQEIEEKDGNTEELASIPADNITDKIVIVCKGETDGRLLSILSKCITKKE